MNRFLMHKDILLMQCIQLCFPSHLPLKHIVSVWTSPQDTHLIHFFQNRPSSNIMMELPHLHEASKKWLQASHTFKTTLPSRIKDTMYLYLLQEKAERKWGGRTKQP